MRLLSCLFVSIFAFGLYALPTQAAANKAPKIKNTDFTAAQHPYGDASKAPNDIEKAFKTAQATHRLVLLDFGANWCPDCRVLAGIFENPEMSKFIKQHFVLVSANVEHLENENMKIAHDLGADIHAIPTVLVLTPEKKLVNKEGLLSLGDARKMNVQQVANLLQSWINQA